ncbi:hypothetical protein JW698_01980 [Candidatus Wolfebacteria bacterium]|nr:hypothetical protein [Candidatus Wolfebacteria bacterium]
MAFFFLLKEFLSFSLPDLSFSSKKKLIIWGISFLVIQLLWVISLLPINFLNAASFTLLIALILQDFIVQFSKGTINRQIILRNATVFLILSLIIFGASKWTP